MENRVGQQLGNYHIVQLLGRGGFADVYQGEHIYLKTQAAIKVLQARLSSPEDINSFLKEAQTVAHLSHPHIVRVIDFGITEEIPFLVMDYAPNGTLRQRHPRGTPLPLTTIIPYVKQIADALQYAHDEKLIHRDIKQENLLLGRRNEVLLSDFGIALIAQSSRYQNTQDAIGTVAYMSPEQIQGRPRPASDQYSLGIVIYEWLCGERPFHGSFTELCTQHMFAPPPPLHEKVSGVPPHVEQVVMTALAKEPKQRFGSIQAFANALKQASQPQQQPPTIPTLQADQPAKAQPLPAIQPTPLPQPPTPKPQAEVAPSPQANRPINTPPTPEGPVTPPARQQQMRLANSNDQVSEQSSQGQRITTIIVGTIFFAIFDYFLNILVRDSSYSSFLTTPIDNSSYLPMSIYILYGLSLCIPCFFSAAFSPWIGLISVVIGTLAGDALAQNILPWYSYMSIAIVGLFPGLPFQRYPEFVVRPIIMSTLGIIVGAFCQAAGSSLVAYLTPDDAFAIFSATALSFAFCLPLLSILLYIYNNNIRRKTKTTPSTSS